MDQSDRSGELTYRRRGGGGGQISIHGTRGQHPSPSKNHLCCSSLPLTALLFLPLTSLTAYIGACLESRDYKLTRKRFEVLAIRGCSK